MRFFSAVAIAVASLASFASAQTTSAAGSTTTSTPGVGLNAIYDPTVSTIVNAGDTHVIKWTPDASVTSVSVFLRKNNGNPNNSDNLGALATNIPNSGSYAWVVSKSLVAGTDYAIELTWGPNDANTQFSTPFTITSSATAVSSDSSASVTSSSLSSATSASNSSLSMTTSTKTSSHTTGTTSATSTGTSTGAPNPNNAMNLASSPLALILGVVAAAVYLH